VAQERRSTPAPADQNVTAARVPNARPISAMPPDPRDTTRAIEKEARMAQYRDRPAPIQGKDSREREAGRAPPPSRPIVASAGSEGSARALGSGDAKPILPPVSGAPARPATTAAADDIQARLGVTREWLASASETTHTIQLLGTNNEEQLKAQLKTLSGMLDPDKIYVFRTLAQGKSSTTVLYGAYPDRRTASQARETLPAAVAANQPVLRTVAGIRRELKQHGLAQQ
jgi:septal ring-binding cell division protein DamX